MQDLVAREPLPCVHPNQQGHNDAAAADTKQAREEPRNHANRWVGDPPFHLLRLRFSGSDVLRHAFACGGPRFIQDLFVRNRLGVVCRD
jgi:hypothetical protein